MAVPKTVALAAALLISMVTIDVVMAGPSTAMVSRRCNNNLYTSGDPFAYSLDYVLNDLVTVTPNRQGYDYYTNSPYPTSIAYGHATCNQGLSSSDCVTCVMSARDQLLNVCLMSVGAQIVLYDCKMRYEQYPFTDN